MMQRKLFTLILLISFYSSISAQGILITGTLTDEDERPLIGASVVEKNTVNATVTDFDGRFSLTVSDSLSSLIFSYTGFASQEHKLDGKKGPLKIQLREGIPMDEVVVSGFSKDRRERKIGMKERAFMTPDFAPRSAEPASIVTFSESPAMAPAEMRMTAVADEAGRGDVAGMLMANSDASAGTLTAGEIHDFSKWDLWEDIAAEDLVNWREFWQMYPIQRYPLQLTNQKGQAVVNAVVRLMDERGNLVWTARTDNTGKAELWDQLFSTQKGPNRNLKMVVEYDGWEYPLDKLSSFQQGYNFLSIPVTCNNNPAIDIAFVVDATGSMQDEIDYLKAELQDVIQRVKDTLPDADLHLGSVFYRDQGEEYLTRKTPFSSVISRTTEFIKKQDADGGGDNPEAVEEALRVALEEMEWRPEASTRLMFLVLDAPPHQSPEILATLKRLTLLAASKGIRIVPLACSGIDKSTEYLMRSLALATNGTYTFLTNDSGIGLSHIEPTTDHYDVEKLNALLARVIYHFAFTRNCDERPPIAYNPPVDTGMAIAQAVTPENENQPATIASLRFYPNPSSGPVNVKTDGIGELYLADFSGKILERFTIKEQSSTIDIGQYPAGTYHLRFRTEDDQWMGDELVLTR